MAPKADLRRDAGGRATNAMSVDVEEYFQVHAMSQAVPRASWEGKPSRVDHATHRVLDLFAETGVKATFFVLGWIAERHTDIVRRIVAEGHELASHGYEHARVPTQSPAEFRADVRRTKATLEQISGQPVIGYRAATFSIGAGTMWAFEVLAEEGHAYSSSISPIRHDLYGMPDAPRFPFYPRAQGEIVEIPITALRLGGRNLPCGGGGFFRLLPYAWSRWAISRFNRNEGCPAIFYFHPWEADPNQPRQPGLGLKSRFRHYVNLHRMEGRLKSLASDFGWDRIDRVFANALTRA